jgi:ABC-type thiamine transport system ATPase subunit
MIVLDEIDKAFQAKLATEILSSIFTYCRTNRIICLVAAHSTEVKNMHYDQVLRFDNGKIN